MSVRLSRQTRQVLEAFLLRAGDWKYGYDISRNTGLKSGTLYPILMRLAEGKLLEAAWETRDNGKPPRHLYRLTPHGLRFAREHARQSSATPVARASFGGMKS